MLFMLGWGAFIRQFEIVLEQFAEALDLRYHRIQCLHGVTQLLLKEFNVLLEFLFAFVKTGMVRVNKRQCAMGNMVLKLEIETWDRELDATFSHPGASVDLGNDVRVISERTVVRKAFDVPQFLIELSIQFVGGVSSSIVAALLIGWLRSFKGRVEKIKLEKTEINFDDEEKIRKIVIKKIEKTTGPDHS